MRFECLFLYQILTLDIDVIAQWFSGRVLESRLTGRGFEPHRRHCVVSLSKNINPSLVLVQARKTRPYIAEKECWLDVKNQMKQANKGLCRFC